MQTKTTGFIRKIDQLGRITIPMEFRRRENILDEDELEMVITTAGLLIRKHNDIACDLDVAVSKLKRAAAHAYGLGEQGQMEVMQQIEAIESRVSRALRGGVQVNG